VEAAQKAINSPLLEASMDGAHGVLLSIAGGSDLGLFEINEAASLVQEAAHEDANIIFGTVIDDSLGDEVRVTVIAAGFDSTPSTLPPLDRGTAAGRRAMAGAAAGQVRREPVGAAVGGSPGGGPAASGNNGYQNGSNGHGGNGEGAAQPQQRQEQQGSGPHEQGQQRAPQPDQRYGRAAGQPYVPPNPPSAPPQRTAVSMQDDDDVDVPPFMKR